MAVFPDRIVLKNSTDNQATIEAAIGVGGTDEITQGEVVLGILNSDVKFYTKAGDGSIVSLGGTGTGPQSLGDLQDVDLSTPATDGQVIAYNDISGNWEPVDQTGGVTSIIAGTGISVDQSTGDVTVTATNDGATSINDLTDVDTSSSPPANDQVLVWDGANWVPGDQTGGTGGLAYWGGGDFTTGTSDGQPADGGTFT